MRKLFILAVVPALLLGAETAHAALLTFDEFVTFTTSLALDADGGGVDDVLFTTMDLAGFSSGVTGLGGQPESAG